MGVIDYLRSFHSDEGSRERIEIFPLGEKDMLGRRLFTVEKTTACGVPAKRLSDRLRPDARVLPSYRPVDGSRTWLLAKDQIKQVFPRGTSHPSALAAYDGLMGDNYMYWNADAENWVANQPVVSTQDGSRRINTLGKLVLGTAALGLAYLTATSDAGSRIIDNAYDTVQTTFQSWTTPSTSTVPTTAETMVTVPVTTLPSM